MILVDYSSVVHRKIYTAIVDIAPGKDENGKFITEEFIDYAKFEIVNELFKISQEFSPRFGEIVICLDNKSPEGYWRKDVFSAYKATRSKDRQESDINFSTVWPEINKVTDAIIEFLPWRTIEVHRAEADDIILVLAEEFAKYNPDLDYSKPELLIHSPDKDMIQSQIGNDIVHQFSALTNKWILPDSKSESMDQWILEHICLGDVSDNVPKIVDGTEFTDKFIEYLSDNGIECDCPVKFKKMDISIQEKINLIEKYDIYYLNRAGEPQEKEIYKKMRSGPATLNKAIAKFGDLDSFLDSNRQYRENYERNKILVLAEGIPGYIRENTLKEFKEASTEYKRLEFEEFVKENNIGSLLLEIPPSISSKLGELTAEDFGW